MKNYLSFGGGVNSVALYLLLEQQGINFEAVFVDHGGDWPETYEYVDYFISTGRPVTILHPKAGTREKVTFSNIVDYLEFKKILPSKNKKKRFCTDRFKISPFNKYAITPCFVFIGFASDEADRAQMSSTKGIEYRWPLIEQDVTRQGCIEIIRGAGLVVPRKSGCYICPFQGRAEYQELRMAHPDLFCRAIKMEKAQNSRVKKDGTPWKEYYLAGSFPLSQLVNDKQRALPGLEEIEYPPCQCGL